MQNIKLFKVKNLAAILMGVSIGVAPMGYTGEKEAPISEESSSTTISGNWSGQAGPAFGKKTLNLQLIKDEKGALLATLDSLEEGVFGLKVDQVSIENDTLFLDIKGLKTTFKGVMDIKTRDIVGTLMQADVSYPLTLKWGVTAQNLNRPQEPKAPYPYLEQEVSYLNKLDGVKLSGTLTLPSTKGVYPAVILIAGTGPNDRDETLLGHKPFKVIADHLTKMGIACLRYDKRGVGKSEGVYNMSTLKEFADDVKSGFEYLQTRSDINVNQIGLIGHSEGGEVAVLAAHNISELAFIVSMGAPGVDREKICYEQGRQMLLADGFDEKKIEFDQKLRRILIETIKKEPSVEKAEKELIALFDKELSSLSEEDRKWAKEHSVASDNLLKLLNTHWFRFCVNYDTESALKKIKVPFLGINGTRDVFVPPKQNLPVILQALKEANNPDFTLLELPEQNHFFQICKTGSFAEFGQIENTIEPSVLNLIADWIVARTIKATSNQK